MCRPAATEYPQKEKYPEKELSTYSRKISRYAKNTTTPTRLRVGRSMSAAMGMNCTCEQWPKQKIGSTAHRFLSTIAACSSDFAGLGSQPSHSSEHSSKPV